mmetsp:Transcript_15135/g.23104  ORF Transcript_15135/g.23104 Transcript_15135/m.23104 type:complete len:347 (-) Transcript_15135:24-1064(-)
MAHANLDTTLKGTLQGEKTRILGRSVEVVLLGTQRSHHCVEDSELQGSQGTDHDASCAQALGAQLHDTGLLGDVHHARGDGAIATSACLVHLGEEGVRRVGDDGGDDTGNDTRAQRDTGVGDCTALRRRAAHAVVDGLGDTTLHGELSHRVRNLLEEDGSEARVEAAHNTFLLDEPGGDTRQAGGVGGVRDRSDAAGLQGAQEDICNELGTGRSSQVDGSSAVPGLLLAHGLHGLDLEELDTAELEPTLDEVADSGGTQTSGKGSDTLLGNDSPEATNHAGVVLDRVQLDSSLHDIDGADGAMGEAAADATCQCGLGVVGEVELGEVGGRHGGKGRGHHSAARKNT